MAKLVRLVYAVWKSDREFNPRHYPWEAREPGSCVEANSAVQVDAAAEAPSAAAEPRQDDFAVSLQTVSEKAANKAAAGHTQESILPRKVVTAATCSVKPVPELVKPQAQQRPLIDYAALRAEISLEQVLDQLGWLGQLRGRRPQLRGPCPVHGQLHDPRRSFSVNLERQAFRCFYPACGAQGNALDLWAAVKQLPLYEAALDLTATLGLSLPSNRREAAMWVLEGRIGSVRSTGRRQAAFEKSEVSQSCRPRALSVVDESLLAMLVHQGSDPKPPYETFVIRQSAKLLERVFPIEDRRRYRLWSASTSWGPDPLTHSIVVR
jgi:hypothetical protein